MKPYYYLNRILYVLVQFTWGIIQNLAGLLLYVLLAVVRPAGRRFHYHGAAVTEWGARSSMGLGMFIFLGHAGEDAAYRNQVLVHEYGHTVQSCLLGPLFLPVIGLPSLLWCRLPVFVARRRAGKCTYFDFYPESWANRCGERVLHMRAPGSCRADLPRGGEDTVSV